MGFPEPQLIGEETEPEAPTGPTICYHCETVLGSEAAVCLECGRRQYRACFCGEHIRPDAATCPHCGADWSHSARVKSRRKSVKRGSAYGIVRSAVTGALTFSAAGGFLYLAGGRAAQGLGVEAPPSMMIRLAYLGKSISLNASTLGQRALESAGNAHILHLLALLGIGAGLGVLSYLVRHNGWVKSRLGPNKSRRREA